MLYYLIFPIGKSLHVQPQTTTGLILINSYRFHISPTDTEEGKDDQHNRHTVLVHTGFVSCLEVLSEELIVQNHTIGKLNYDMQT